MITPYNTLRNKYIVDGYQQAFEYIGELQQSQEYSETLLTNFYCYIIIQAQFKAEEILSILETCINSQDCKGSLRALTLYHIASVYFKTKHNMTQCKSTCQKILQQFLGLHYSIQMRLDKSRQQIQLYQELQQILYYAMLMMAYISKHNKNKKQMDMYLQAAKRIIKDRKNIMSLTTKTTITENQGSYINGNMSNEKNVLRNCKNQINQSKDNISINMNINMSRNKLAFANKTQ